MFSNLPRITLIAAALSLPLPALAVGPNDQLLALVSSEMPRYAPNVDASTLRRGQLAMIYSIMHSDRTESNKRLHIRSVLGGRNTLRGLLFN